MHDQSQITQFPRLIKFPGLVWDDACRHSTGAELNIRTNVEMIMPTINQVASAAFD